MCGIGGFVDPRGALDGPEVLRTLARTLAHRGPDGEGSLSRGVFGLAHRRLAIIDLSESGAQPMRIGAIAVVFNGEIYNYRELREELRREGQTFIGASDTEVLARAYLQWGEHFVTRLRGMWAFAIVDERAQVLLCSRDPFGIKPFYYTWHEGAFMFASEPAALVQAGVPARANLQVAAQYLALGLSDQGRDGFFQNIQQLEPGQTVRVGADAVLRSVDTPTATANGSVASFAEFAASLETSVRLHLRSDVPVGTCLSGGLDSSTLAALASKMVRAAGGPRFAAVTAGSADTRTDERPFAAEVVRHCDLVWEVVIPSAAEFTSEIETCLRVQGEPVGGPSVYFQYCVMRAARAAGLKVMLDGQGADELLCGYERYVPTWGLEIAGKQGPWAALRGVVRLAHNYRFGVRGMFALAAYVTLPPLRRYLIGRRTAFLRAEFSPSIVEVVTRIASASRHLHSARIADIAHFSLPALLRYEDRNSMAHSIEARVPYVDKEVVACALRLSDTELLQEGFTKYPLRTVAASILPASIAWRRFKIGFEPPTQTWLAVLKDRMQTEIDASPLIARLVHVVPRMHQLPLAMQWRLYNLACWQRLFAVGVD